MIRSGKKRKDCSYSLSLLCVAGGTAGKEKLRDSTETSWRGRGYRAGKGIKAGCAYEVLEESSPLGANHPAVKQYNKCMRGAGDTVRSIIISANSRLAFLENKQVLRLLSKMSLICPISVLE